MKKAFYSLMLVTLILAGCGLKNSPLSASPTIEPSPQLSPTATQIVITENPETPITVAIPSPTITSSPTVIDLPTPTKSPTHLTPPLIQTGPGETYETVFTIPVGGNSVIQYFRGGGREVTGPNAIAVLPGLSLMIADQVGNRLLHYEPAGQLLKVINLTDLGIEHVSDMRRKGDALFLLENLGLTFRVHHMSLDGTLIASEEIPYDFHIGEENYTLYNGLTGIAVDCDGSVLLELGGGFGLFRLPDVQGQSSPDNITKGYFCNGKRYREIDLRRQALRKISAGDVIYETRMTFKDGSFGILDVLPDGSFYVVRDDVVTDPQFTVDETVHYIGADGAVQGVARCPLAESYYSINRRMAISPTGEVFAILPHPDLIEIIRLIFYTELEPLIPGAAIPQITINPNSP